MSSCRLTKLSRRGLIRVAGDDAHKFLQNLITADLERLEEGAALHAALLTPQGKILFDFFLVEAKCGLLLDCPQGVVGDLIKRLTFYKLRAAVDIIDLSEEHEVWAAWNGTPDTAHALTAFVDPRLAALGFRLVVPSDVSVATTGCEEVTEAEYDAHRIALGIPEGGRDFTYGDAFPHEADFDQLGSIDFEKGCFVGQEVVSRMQHRGTARKRIVPVAGNAELIPGMEVTAGGRPLGTMGTVAGKRGLATLRLDRAAAAIEDGKRIEAGGVSLRLIQPDWATFTVPTGSSA